MDKKQQNFQTPIGKGVSFADFRTPVRFSEFKNKKFEESIKRSIDIQAAVLNLKAKQARNRRKADAFRKISALWKQSNETRDQLREIQESYHYLYQLIQKNDILENEESYLKKYFDIRSKVDPLYNALSELIDNQKRLFKINNCSEEDFNKITELLESCSDSKNSEAVEKATIGLMDVEEMANDIKSMEKELEECHKRFEICIEELEKYERIENQIFPEK